MQPTCLTCRWWSSQVLLCGLAKGPLSFPVCFLHPARSRVICLSLERGRGSVAGGLCRMAMGG